MHSDSDNTPEIKPSRRTNRSRYIFRNTVSSYARDVVDTIVFLALIPFIIYRLGAESFGLWSLIWSFLALFELADLGFGASVIKYVADARGRDDSAGLKKIVCTLFWIYVVLGVVVMIGVAASLLFFNSLFQIPAGQRDAAQATLLILGFRSSLYLPLGLYRGVLVGYQKMSVANWYKALASVLYLLATLAFLTFFPDIRVLALINMITGILPMFAMAIHTKRVAPYLSVHPRQFEWSLVKELSSFSIYFSLTQVARLIATRADAMVIKLFLPLELVGVYSVGMRLTDKANQFCSHLARALTPVYAELHGASERSDMRAAYYLGSKMTTAFATPLLLGLAMLAHPLILAWTGPDFGLSATVCQWLVAATAISLIHLNSVNLMGMAGYQRYAAFSLVSVQVLNLVLSVIMIGPLGIVGVAMATFIAYTPVYMTLIQQRVGGILERPFWEYYRRAVLPSFVPGLVMAGMMWLAQRYWNLTNLFEVALLECLGIGVFWIVFWGAGFEVKERDYFKKKVLRALLGRETLRNLDATASPREK